MSDTITVTSNSSPLSVITVRIPGPGGSPGAPGRDIELQRNTDYIQWRYVGDTNWITLVSIADLTPTEADLDLSAYAKKIDINSLATAKADKTYVDTELADKAETSDVTAALALKANANDPRLTDTRTPTDNTVSTAKLQDSAVTSEKIANGTIQNVDISDTAAISADKTADGTNNKVFTAAEKTKLSGVANGATANATDAQLRDRSTHTGTQAASTITGLATVATTGDYADLLNKPAPGSSYTDEQVRDVIAAALRAGSNVSIVVDDAADTITINSTATGGTSYTDENARDAIGTALRAGSNVTISVDDASDTITINANVPAGYTDEQARDAIATALVAGTNISIVPNDAADTITINATAAPTTVENIPAGSTLTVRKSGSTWPARPTARNDVIVQWVGAEPSPTIVSSGTGGMLDNVDLRLIPNA